MKNKKILFTSILIVILGGVIVTKNGIKTASFKEDIEKEPYSEINYASEIDDELVTLEVSVDASYKTGDIEELYKDSSVVAIADYVEDKETIIEKNDSPYTLMVFSIKKIIKNDSAVKIGNKVITKKMGGTITVQQLLEARDAAFAEKLGVNNLTKEEKNSKYVKFYNNTNLGDKDLKEHKTRLLFLNYDEKNEYFVIVQDDYGMLSYNEENNTAFDITNQGYKEYSFLKEL